jgi:cytochrome b involved in lipid metabolism
VNEYNINSNMSVKASINGPNNRRNRAGDTITPLGLGSAGEIEAALRLPFMVRSLDKFLSSQKNLSIESLGNACLFTIKQNGSGSGQKLLMDHCKMSGIDFSSQFLGASKRNVLSLADAPCIHFHDIPIFVLRAIPWLNYSDNDQGEEHDCLYLSDVHCHNNKICVDTVYNVVCCSRISADNGVYSDYFPLSIVGIEVFLRFMGESSEKTVLHANDVAKALSNHTLFSILTVNECLVVTLKDIEVVCRVYKVCLESNHDYETILDDPYCGRVTVNTRFFIETSNKDAIILEGSKSITDEDLGDNVVHVTTSDGEWFPVRREILAPCLKLTKYVQAGRGRYKNIDLLPISERSEDAPPDGIHCKVQIDCCTFDRCLLYIMSQLYPKKYKFVLDLSETNTLTSAAETLGLETLKGLCDSQQSSFASRVRKDNYIRFGEVVHRNTQNELLIIIDGMVLDISRWLDEHPGGASIIPTQAINIDCTSFFEMYHVSKQSFLYLKQFYIGELAPSDIPQLEGHYIKASDGFLQSLRGYTEEWRVKIKEGEDAKVHKSL